MGPSVIDDFVNAVLSRGRPTAEDFAELVVLAKKFEAQADELKIAVFELEPSRFADRDAISSKARALWHRANEKLNAVEYEIRQGVAHRTELLDARVRSLAKSMFESWHRKFLRDEDSKKVSNASRR